MHHRRMLVALLRMGLVLLLGLCLSEGLRRSLRTMLFFMLMWRESSWSELVQEFHGKYGGISRITCTVSTG